MLKKEKLEAGFVSNELKNEENEKKKNGEEKITTEELINKIEAKKAKDFEQSKEEWTEGKEKSFEEAVKDYLSCHYDGKLDFQQAKQLGKWIEDKDNLSDSEKHPYFSSDQLIQELYLKYGDKKEIEWGGWNSSTADIYPDMQADSPIFCQHRHQSGHHYPDYRFGKFKNLESN